MNWTDLAPVTRPPKYLRGGRLTGALMAERNRLIAAHFMCDLADREQLAEAFAVSPRTVTGALRQQGVDRAATNGGRRHEARQRRLAETALMG